MINSLKGWLQSMVLALFFLPYILPVSVVFLIWQWTFDFQFGIAQYALDTLGMERIPVFRDLTWLYARGRIGHDLVDQRLFDSAVFGRITWPLIWPITSLVLTIQMILQLKIFDQVYLFGQFGRPNETMVLVRYVFKRAFIQDYGGRGAAVAVTLFVIVVVVSVLQYQLLRSRGEK